MRTNPSATLYLLNYADDRFGHKGGHFKKNQEALNASPMAPGIENIVSWTWVTLCSTKFYQEHSELLNKNRFENGNVWKPYIVLELLEKIREGDIILYCDCGPYTIDVSIEPLIKLCVRNRGTLFHQWGEYNAKWTKRDAFVYMGCDTKRYHNAPALQNSWFLIQKNKVTLEFVKEWLHYNLDERIASYIKPNTCGPTQRAWIC